MITLITDLAACAIVVLCIWAFSSMGPSTKHCFRFAYGLIGISAVGIALQIFTARYNFLRPYFGSGLVWGFALYMMLDRRRIGKGNNHGL